MSDGEWAPYVSVAKRQARAAREINRLRKSGTVVQPIEIQGRQIAQTFWGKAWCAHLEKFSDYQNRLPRGRTYVRNGSVCHLAISKGQVEAIVSGSELYKVAIGVSPLSKDKWKNLRQQCTGQIGSMLELLQGRFSDNVMNIVTEQHQGLFPNPGEIKLACDCPDSAQMCKHIAAVLYGVGARLDHQPDLLFHLRNVDHEELIAAELDIQAATSRDGRRRRLAGVNLADVFGVEMAEPAPLSRKEKFAPTAATVRRLRKKFGMNTSEFAKLAGVSAPTVSNWENSSGKLRLRQRSLAALTKLNDLPVP